MQGRRQYCEHTEEHLVEAERTKETKPEPSLKDGRREADSLLENHNEIFRL